MLQTNVSFADRIHRFNECNLALDRIFKEQFEIDLLLMPEELRQNSIVAAQWHTSGGKNVCPLCHSLEGDIIPVNSPEWGRIVPVLSTHQNCQCTLSYITARERGVEARIKRYRPIDPELLKRWSSKLYTKAEIAEMAKHHEEFVPEEI